MASDERECEGAARAEATAFEGGQAVDLAGSPGAGVIETTFATTPGTEYTLIFYYARNDLLGSNVGRADVEVLGTSTLLSETVEHDPALLPFTAYQQFSEVFTADGNQAVLRFTSLNGGSTGVTIDAISIEAAPPVPALSPVSALALLLALSALSIPVLHPRRSARD